MKIKRESQRKKILPVVLATIILLIAGYFAYAYTAHSWPWASSNDSPTSQLSTNSDSSDESDSTTDTSTDNPSQTGPDKTPTQNEETSGGDSNKSDSDISGVINYKKVASGKLTIRVTIDKKLDSGTCKLTLTRKTDGKTVHKSAEVLSNPSSSTCKGFDVPTSELGSGQWDIVINVKNGNAKGTITGAITV